MSFESSLLLAPAAALAGVVVAQAIALITDRRRRTAEHLKEARASGEELLVLFQEYRDLIAGNRSISKSDPYKFEVDEWGKRSATATRASAMLTGRRGHRQIVTTFIAGLNLAEQLGRDGQGLTSSVNRDFYVMADMGFEVIAAWLRYERVPRQARRTQGRLLRELYWYGLEWRSRDEYARTGRQIRSGLFRRVWRGLARWMRKDTKKERLWIKDACSYLFRQ